VAAFSKYIIYADESGSPHLEADRNEFPIFVLNFLVVEKRVYSHQIEPDVQAFKFAWFGHDQIIFHEKDIVKQRGAFSFLRKNPTLRQRFLEGLTPLVARCDQAFDYAIIDKARMQQGSTDPWSPYDIALGICMERAAERLLSLGESGTQVHVVFEARGSKEDQLLELDFGRIARGHPRVSFGTSAVQAFDWVPIFADKRSNSTGLQLSDLAARPLGLSYLRPNQLNKAFSAMRTTSATQVAKVYP
jgi:hypothetical protein